jgi:hypothetical protein
MRLGLKFLLKDMHFFIAQMSQDKASAIVGKWLRGEYQNRTAPRFVGEVLPEGSWAVDMDAVVGVHTVEISDQPPPQQGPYRGLSGIN